MTEEEKAIKRTVKAGTLFSVPLESGGIAVGLVFRSARSTVRLSAFYLGFSAEAAGELTCADLRRRKPDLTIRHGLLGFTCSTWQVIKQTQDFSIQQWPMPQFFSESLMGGDRGVLQGVDERTLAYTGNLTEEIDRPPECVSAGLVGHLGLEDLLSHLASK